MNVSVEAPSEQQLNDMLEQLRVHQLPRFMMCMDSIERYVYSKTKHINWTKLIALLFIITEKDLTPSRLAWLLHRASTGITPLINALEDDGLVKRSNIRMRHDRRITRLSITPAGFSYAQQALNEMYEVEEELFGFLGENRTETLVVLARTLRLRLFEGFHSNRGGWQYCYLGHQYRLVGQKNRAKEYLQKCISVSREKVLTEKARQELDQLER